MMLFSFFDQDSRIEEGHVEKMLAVSAQLCTGGWNVGCLGPVYFNTSSGTVEIPKAKKWLVGETYGVSSFCRFMTTSSDNNTSANAISVLTGIVLRFFQQGIDLTSQRLGEHDTHGIKHP